MRIFLTGGTGFIGSHVLSQALALGHTVHAIRRPGKEPNIKISGNITWKEGGLRDDWGQLLRETDVLIHLSAYGVINGSQNWQECFQVNVNDSLALWLQAIEHGVKNFVVCGSCFEYGKSGMEYESIPPNAPLWPTTAYAASKAAATMAAIALAETHSLNLTIARPFHVYGEGENSQRFWSSLVKAAEEGRDYEMTRGEQIRDFITVQDAANKILQLAQEELSPRKTCNSAKIINIGSGRPQRLRDFAKAEWMEHEASGNLILGAIPYRTGEVFRYTGEVINEFKKETSTRTNESHPKECND